MPEAQLLPTLAAEATPSPTKLWCICLGLANVTLATGTSQQQIRRHVSWGKQRQHSCKMSRRCIMRVPAHLPVPQLQRPVAHMLTNTAPELPDVPDGSPSSSVEHDLPSREHEPIPTPG